MKIILANPRGFCAGVNMAIECLDKAISMFGSNIYVYHEIVHNKYVVENPQMDPKIAEAVKVFNNLLTGQPRTLGVSLRSTSFPKGSPFFDDPLEYIAAAGPVVRAALEKALNAIESNVERSTRT